MSKTMYHQIDRLFLIPEPKLVKIDNTTGLRLTKELYIFINKHKIRDFVLQTSSVFLKNLGVFIDSSPILDSKIPAELGEIYFFAKICLDIKTNLKTEFEQILKATLSEFARMGAEPYSEQAYAIVVRDEGAWIISKTRVGFQNGIQTFNQILKNVIIRHNNPEEFIKIPKLMVVDYPTNLKREIPQKLFILPDSKDEIEEIINKYREMRYNYLKLNPGKNIERFKAFIEETCKLNLITIENDGQADKIISNNSPTLDTAAVLGIVPLNQKTSKLYLFLLSEYIWNYESDRLKEMHASPIAFLKRLLTEEPFADLEEKVSLNFFEMNPDNSLLEIKYLLGLDEDVSSLASKIGLKSLPLVNDLLNEPDLEYVKHLKGFEKEIYDNKNVYNEIVSRLLNKLLS